MFSSARFLFCLALTFMGASPSFSQTEKKTIPPKNLPRSASHLQKPIKVMLLSLHQNQQSTFEQDLLKEGLKRAGVQLVDASQQDARFKNTLVDNARQNLTKAKAAYRLLDIPKAQQYLHLAHEEFLTPKTGHADLPLLVELLLLRAEISLAANDKSTAIEEDLRLAARLAPLQKELHPGLYPPVLVEAYTKAVLKNKNSGRGLTIIHLFYPAKTSKQFLFFLMVDGKEVSFTEKDSLALTQGPHLLHFRSTGGNSKLQRLVVSEQPQILSFFVGAKNSAAQRQKIRKKFETLSQTKLSQKEMQALLHEMSFYSSATTYLWQKEKHFFAYDLQKGFTRLNTPVTANGARLGVELLQWLSPAAPLSAPITQTSTAIASRNEDEAELSLWAWAALPASALFAVGIFAGATSLWWILAQQNAPKKLPPPYELTRWECCASGVVAP